MWTNLSNLNAKCSTIEVIKREYKLKLNVSLIPSFIHVNFVAEDYLL